MWRRPRLATRSHPTDRCKTSKLCLLNGVHTQRVDATLRPHHSLAMFPSNKQMYHRPRLLACLTMFTRNKQMWRGSHSVGWADEAAARRLPPGAPKGRNAIARQQRRSHRAGAWGADRITHGRKGGEIAHRRGSLWNFALDWVDTIDIIDTIDTIDTVDVHQPLFSEAAC